MSRVDKREEIGYTSTLVLSQVIAHLIRRKRVEAIDKFLSYAEETLVVVETLAKDFVEARRMRESMRVSWRMWDDLVIASQMRRLGISEIYSNDSDFDKIRGIKRILE